MRPWKIAVITLGAVVSCCLLIAVAAISLRSLMRRQYRITDSTGLDARQRAEEAERRYEAARSLPS